MKSPCYSLSAGRAIGIDFVHTALVFAGVIQIELTGPKLKLFVIITEVNGALRGHHFTVSLS